MRIWWLVPVAAMIGAAAPQSTDELITFPDDLVAGEIDGSPARLHIRSGGPDRLVLNADYVAAHGIQPAAIMGKADLTIAGRKEFQGRNRPLRFSVAGMPQKGRAFWFSGALATPGDGAIGPWALPQPIVTFALRAAQQDDQRFDLPLTGDINSSSMSGWQEPSFATLVSFDLDDRERYPIATAATGAAIAAVYGGTLSGPSWDVEVGMGVMRPVRLMTLERPFVLTPFSFTRIAVRVRDRVDDSGRGGEIRDADTVQDPSEIVVTAKSGKAPKPAFLLTIPRWPLNACARLSFDKRAKRISLWCPPAVAEAPAG